MEIDAQKLKVKDLKTHQELAFKRYQETKQLLEIHKEMYYKVHNEYKQEKQKLKEMRKALNETKQSK